MPSANCQFKIVRDSVRVGFVRYCIALVAVVLAGCSTARFEVIDPPGMVHAIDGSSDVVGAAHGIVYHARVIDNLVVFRIENTTAEQLELSHSVLIDPGGVQRPMEDQPLPAGSFVKLILPPPPPDPTGGPMISIDLSSDGPRRKPEQNWGWGSGGVVTLELAFKKRDGGVMMRMIRMRRV